MYGLKIHFDIGDCLPACGRRSMHTVTTADGTKVTCRACLKIASVGIQQEICTRQSNIAKQVANSYGDLEPCRNCGSTEDLYDTLCGDCNESIAACRIPGNVTYGSRWSNLPKAPLHLSLDGRDMLCGVTNTLHYEYPLSSTDGANYYAANPQEFCPACATIFQNIDTVFSQVTTTALTDMLDTWDADTARLYAYALAYQLGECNYVGYQKSQFLAVVGDGALCMVTATRLGLYAQPALDVCLPIFPGDYSLCL